MSKSNQEASSDSQQKSETSKSSSETPPLVEAMRMISHIITSICLMLAGGGLGYALDWVSGQTFFQFLGFVSGGYLALRYLIRVTS